MNFTTFESQDTARRVVKGAAAFSKSISILQLVADAEEPPVIAELVKKSGMPRPTLHRLLKALAAEGLVEAKPNKTYTVGPRVIQLAGRAMQQNGLAIKAEPELNWLRAETQETVNLAIRTGRDVVYIQKKESPQAVRIATAIGDRVPLHASSIGRCFLAFLLPEERRLSLVENIDLPALTQYTVTDRKQLMDELELIRQRGYANVHQEADLAVECFGVSIFDRDRNPIAGISISVPLFRLNQNKEFYIRPLLECRDRIENKMFNS